MKIRLCFLLIIITLLAACAESGEYTPELLKPVGVRFDTEKATVRNVETIDQYRAAVRTESTPLYFTEEGMRLGSLNYFAGDSVSKGDVLATLNTEEIEKQIKEKKDYIDALMKQYEHNNKMLGYDIEIADLKSAKDPNNTSLKLSAQKLRLQLAHNIELQEIELKWQKEQLTDVEQKLEQVVITAPFDGKLTYVQDILQGDWVQAFQPIFYITPNSSESLIVEYTGSDSVRLSGNAYAVGIIDGKEYRLDYVQLTNQELLSYVLSNKTAPAKFTFADAPQGLEPGMFVSLMVTRNIVEDVLTVPINSLFSGSDYGSYVYVVENGQKIIREVKTGARNVCYVEIVEGIEEGEEIFVKQ